MKKLKPISIVAVLSSVIFPVMAQSNDWQVVERIALGTSIGVRVLNHRGRRGCELLSVTDSGLTCELVRGAMQRQLVFRREEIRDIRLEFPEHHHMLPGALIGALAGGAVGGLEAARTGDPETKMYAPIFAVLVGAAVGGGMGTLIHRHSPNLYERK